MERTIIAKQPVDRAEETIRKLRLRVEGDGVSAQSCSDCDSSNAPMYGEWVDASNELRAIAAQISDVYDEMQTTTAELASASALCAVGVELACGEAAMLARQLIDLGVTLHNLQVEYDIQLAYVWEVTDDLVAWTEDCLNRNCG